MTNRLTDAVVITAAIEGFEAQKQRTDETIAELRNMLAEINGTAVPDQPAALVNGTADPRKGRKLSAAVRRNMAAAQQARHARRREEQEADVPPTQAVPAIKAKRKLSAEGRRNIIAATRRRWEKINAAKQAQKAAPRRAHA